MKNPYKQIFIGYLLLAVKLFQLYMFQIIGIMGYLCILLGLFHMKKTKTTTYAKLSTIGLFVLTGYEFIKAPITDPNMMDMAFVIAQLIAYVVLNWIVLYGILENITMKFNEKKMINDAQLCQKNEKKFMNLCLYSVLCQNCAIMFQRIGVIIFLVGVILAIYLAIAEVIYFRKVSVLI